MINLKYFSIFLIVLLFTNCQTINEKADKITRKENEKLTKFISQPVSKIIISFGEPDYILKKKKGNEIYVYKNKKYGILCERRFEISKKIVIGFTSKGCF